MENNVILQISILLVIFLVIAVAYYCITYLKSKITNEEWKSIERWTELAVIGVEFVFVSNKCGEEKKKYVIEYVLQLCKQFDISIEEDTIRLFIEKTLYKNDFFNKD